MLIFWVRFMGSWHVLIPVGVKKAGIPAPAALILSAIVPCGQSSIATSPDRYFFSNALLFPRNDMINRVICPDSTSDDNPPPLAVPPLFDTSVRSPRELTPLFRMAAMIVSSSFQNQYVFIAFT
jgi:hypothetical protein